MVFDRETVEERLRLLGWEVKSGLLFGGLFVIGRPNEQGHVHSQYIVHFAEGMTYQRLLGSVRIARSVRKKVLLAYEDPDGSIGLAEVDDE